MKPQNSNRATYVVIRNGAGYQDSLLDKFILSRLSQPITTVLQITNTFLTYFHTCRKFLRKLNKFCELNFYQNNYVEIGFLLGRAV